MLKIELLARQESLFYWIKDIKNRQNPQLKGIIKYWLRLTGLIVKMDLEEFMETPPEAFEIEVIDPIIVN